MTNFSIVISTQKSDCCTSWIFKGLTDLDLKTKTIFLNINFKFAALKQMLYQINIEKGRKI